MPIYREPNGNASSRETARVGYGHVHAYKETDYMYRRQHKDPAKRVGDFGSAVIPG